MAKLKEDLKILIVDDSMETVNIMRLFLKNKGLKNVLHCEDGDVALSILEREKTDNNPVQLLLLDLNMPKLPGGEVLKNIRENFEFDNLIVIVVSSENLEDTVKTVAKQRIDGYILKPITADKLFHKIVECVKKVRRLP